MKINKIQCDICGKTVDYNDKKIGDMLYQPSIDINGGFYDQFKVNRFAMYGVTNEKNMQEFIDKKNNYKDAIINMEFDLCEDCLIDLYKIVNEWKKSKEVRE